MNTSGEKIKDLVKIKNNIRMSVRKTHEIKLNDIITWHFYTIQKLSDLSLTFWKKNFLFDWKYIGGWIISQYFILNYFISSTYIHEMLSYKYKNGYVGNIKEYNIFLWWYKWFWKVY